MSRYEPLYNNFTSGELSPYLYDRIDIDQYYNGAKTIENFIILPYGGVMFIPGTYFVHEVKDSSKKVRLIPFKFNVTQSYMLEFGDQYIRFYKDNGIIESAGSPYEISSPYAEADLNDLQFAQNADVMWITHPNYKTKKLTRTDHTSWALTDYTPTNDPFTHDSWQASHSYSEDDYIIPTSPNGYYYRCITAGTSGSSEPSWPTTLNDTVSDGTVTWRCESSNPVNYPATVTFHEQRLWFGYTRANPQTIWATKSGDFEDMTTGTADDDALEYTLGTNEVNVIRWLSARRILAIGTSGGILTMGANDATTPITPTNVMVHRENNEGCYPAMPVMIGTYIYYIHRDGNRIMQFAYDYNSDSYQSIDVTILSEHITGSGVFQMAYQQSPYNLLWCVRSDGDVCILTRNVHQQITGWSRRVVTGDVESIAVIPRGDGDYDEVWMVVKRTINGATKRYVEYLKSYDFDSIEDAFFVDCGLTYSGSSTTTISGLDHLEGENVAILVDGAVHPNKTVTSGQITLDWAGTKVHAGLPYTGTIELLDLDIKSRFQALFGHKRRMFRVILSFYNTVGGKVGREDSLDEILFRDSSMPMDEAVPLFEGLKELNLPIGWDRSESLKIAQEQPLPMILRGIGVSANIGER